MELSIVAPVHNEEGNIREFIQQVVDVVRSEITPKKFEIILVDDGSTDGSWNEIKALSASDQFKDILRGLKLVNNFGQPNALVAGLRSSRGDFVVTMDSDLQHPPKVLKQFWDLRNDFSIIAGKQIKRRENFFKAICSKMFYRCLTAISHFDIDSNVGDFRLMSRKSLNDVLKVIDSTKILRFTIAGLRIPVKLVEFEANSRIWGVTKFSLARMIELAIQSVLTVSVRPLLLSAYFSLISATVALLDFVYILYAWLNFGSVPGWASITGVIASGFFVVFFILGIQSLYLSRIVNSGNGFPLYSIDESF